MYFYKYSNFYTLVFYNYVAIITFKTKYFLLDIISTSHSTKIQA